MQAAEVDRLTRIENSLHHVATERLAGIEGALNRLVEKLNRQRTPSPPHGEAGGQGGGGDDGGHVDGGRHRKLEIPLFEGEDPLGWIFRVERYFVVNGVTEAEKLEAAVVSLEGRALSWFQWTEARTPVNSWQEFKTEVTERFHCKQVGDEYEQLMALRQLGTVAEYREQFEMLSAPLTTAT